MNENNKKENTKLEKTHKYLIAFVDTENISPSGDSGLISLIDYKYSDYQNTGIYCYGIDDGKSGSSVAWKKKCGESSGYFIWKDVEKPREKNKVDEAIKRAIESLLNSVSDNKDSLVLWVIATSDGDYESSFRHIHDKGHKVVIAYSGVPSNKLLRLCDEQYPL